MACFTRRPGFYRKLIQGMIQQFFKECLSFHKCFRRRSDIVFQNEPYILAVLDKQRHKFFPWDKALPDRKVRIAYSVVVMQMHGKNPVCKVIKQFWNIPAAHISMSNIYNAAGILAKA